MPRFLQSMGLLKSSLCHISRHVSRNKHTLPSLPYEYNALEPVISAEIMTVHHQKHHATYVNNLNVAEEALKDATAKNDVGKMIELLPAIRFNGGGHINHTIFWETLTPEAKDGPTGDLLEVINRDFGSYDVLRKSLTAISIGVQGSGWGWIGFNPPTGRLRIASCANQDPLFPTTGLIPIFGIDVWEHAYYLQYKNVRADYVNAIFEIINWDNVAKRYADAVMRT